LVVVVEVLVKVGLARQIKETEEHLENVSSAGSSRMDGNRGDGELSGKSFILLWSSCSSGTLSEQCFMELQLPHSLTYWNGLWL